MIKKKCLKWKLHDTLIQYCLVVDFRYFLANLSHWHFLNWPKTFFSSFFLVFYYITPKPLWELLWVAHHGWYYPKNWFTRNEEKQVFDSVFNFKRVTHFCPYLLEMQCIKVVIKMCLMGLYMCWYCIQCIMFYM